MKTKSYVLSSLFFVMFTAFVSNNSNAQSNLIPTTEFDFKVFPNPSQVDDETYVSVQGFKANDLLVVVYDMLGREIYSKVEVIESDGYLFSLTSDGKRLPAGVYVIIASANDKVFKQKLVVK